MKNLFQASAAEEVERRITALKLDSHPVWGTMNVAQMVAHCSAGLELASADRRPPRALIGRLIGWAIKPMVLRNDEPMRRNSPTVEGLVVTDKRDLEIERKRLFGLINRFVAAGPNGCTKHPHSFFGRLTPDEWAILMYKHLDHHLRQFGVWERVSSKRIRYQDSTFCAHVGFAVLSTNSTAQVHDVSAKTGIWRHLDD